MSQRIGSGVRIGLGLIVSAVCLWLAVRQTPTDDLLATLQHVNYWWLLPVLLGNISGLWVRGIRWRVLLADRGTTSEYFWAQAIGCLLTNVFPLRAGEAGRVLVVSRQVHLPLVQVGASVVIERAADLTIVLGLLASLLLIMDVPWAIMVGGLALGAALAVALLGVAVLTLYGRRLTGVVEAIAGRLPARAGALLIGVWGQVLAALDPLRDVRILIRVALWSLLVWIIVIGTFWAAIEAVVPGARFVEAAFAMAALAVGISLPSSPGFIGVFQLVGQQALVTPFPERFTPVSALSIALLYHLVYYLSTTALGAIGVVRLGLSLRTVRSDKPDMQASEATLASQVSAT